jgi:tRNA pseudouridine13 synthase
LRSEPEDFAVVELPLVTPSGTGEHLLIRLRKRGWTTPAAADALARAFGVAKSRVSYAGMKDRHAITEQSFSIHAPAGDIPASPTLPEGLGLLAVERHHRKLRRGALRGNRFRLRLRGVEAPPTGVHRRLAAIMHRGVPNYFGMQRFGAGDGNIAAAEAWFRGERTPKDRRERGLWISAARSRVFNAVLAARVADGTWQRAVSGDRMMLDGRRSLFRAADEEPGVLAARLAAGGVHPTGPLPGCDGKLPGDEALPEVEQRVLAAYQGFVAALGGLGVEADRRALRVHIGDMVWHFEAAQTLVVEFSLPAGAYATTVLGQVFDLQDGTGQVNDNTT